MPFDATAPGGPVSAAAVAGWRARGVEWIRRRPWFAALVILPTILTAIYMALFAANQYESESRVMVRGRHSQVTSILGMALGGNVPAAEEAQGVASFLKSHDAVRRLQKDVDLVGMFHRNGLDVFAGLKAHPTEEELTKHYLRQVKANLSTSTGILTLQVRAFRPEDAKLVSEKLIGYSEELVNQFSARAEQDALRVSRAEVDRYAGSLSQLTNQATRFRDQSRALDATSSAKVVTDVVGGLEGQVARARAELAAQRSYLQPTSPRVREQEARVAALQAQVESQRSRLTGGAGSLAPTVAGFERLGVERDLATRGYASALTSLEAARVEAQQQHIYLIRVVQPNLPEKSTYPSRALTVLSVFGALLLAYSIGWLILAGVREHAA